MNDIPSARRWKVVAGIGLLIVGAAVVVIQNRPAAPPPATAPAVRAALGPVAVPALSLNEEMQIRPDLREALGKVAGITPQQRLDLLSAVRGTLSPVEANALFRELLEPRPPTVNEGWNSVYVQNLCLILREQPAVRETFARVLATLARDPARDAVVRDYAVQHLRQVWDRAGEESPGQPAPPPAAAVLRASIERTFRDLAAGNEPAMAAAGLLSLHFLGTRQGDGALPAPGQRPALPPGLASVKPQPPHYALPDAELQPLAEKVLSAAPAAATVSLRMTAIRVIAERRLAAAKPSLRAVIAATATEHALTRMAAIGALGSFADPADRPLLENLDRRDVRIATAARTALASFK